MNERSYALDAFRGYAILTMVLSGCVVFGILPAWMYHAQTPPPSNLFNPDIPGITWVDLVFPFFLFAMGAAFPFSINKRLERGEKKKKLIFDSGKRYLELTFFAIFIQHFYPWSLSNPQDLRSWFLALVCFALLFPMFMKLPFSKPKWADSVIKVGAYILAFILLSTVTYSNGKVFNPNYSNIIIIVLANMAFWGTLIYVFTRNHKALRLLFLPCIIAIMLGSDIAGSYTKAIYDFTPIAWIYKFVYLKYLIIVIPGTIAGDFLSTWMNNRAKNNSTSVEKSSLVSILLIISMGVILCNLICLYNRWVTSNLIINIAVLLGGIIYLELQKDKSETILLWKNLFSVGSYFILIGLLLEPFQGGIKKDPSTFSYLLLTAGLAFLAILVFNIVLDYYKIRKPFSFLYLSGQNPMIAYVSTNLLVIPLLNITGIYGLFTVFSTNAWLGFLQGLLLTSLTILISVFFTKIKWFWRT